MISLVSTLMVAPIFNAGTIKELIDALTVAFAPETVSISSVSDATESEGADLAHTVTLSGSPAAAVTFAYSLADVTTTHGRQ